MAHDPIEVLACLYQPLLAAILGRSPIGDQRFMHVLDEGPRRMCFRFPNQQTTVPTSKLLMAAPSTIVEIGANPLFHDVVGDPTTITVNVIE